jgi:subtilisin
MGACASMSSAAVVTKVVGDAMTYNQLDAAYGFTGDPLHPVAGKHYGYLVHAAS